MLAASYWLAVADVACVVGAILATLIAVLGTCMAIEDDEPSDLWIVLACIVAAVFMAAGAIHIKA